MANTEKPNSSMRRIRKADPVTLKRAPCRYSRTGASGLPSRLTFFVHKPCGFTGWPVSPDTKPVQTSLMPSAARVPPYQLRSGGWKIHCRCFSSSVAQPASKAMVASRAAISFFIAEMERVQEQKFRSEWQEPYQVPYQIGGKPHP